MNRHTLHQICMTLRKRERQCHMCNQFTLFSSNSNYCQLVMWSTVCCYSEMWCSIFCYFKNVYIFYCKKTYLMSESCTDAVCPDVWGHVGAGSGEKGVFVQAGKHHVRYVHCISFTVWQCMHVKIVWFLHKVIHKKTKHHQGNTQIML